MRSGAVPTEGDVMEQWKLYGAIYADAEPPADASRVGVSATAEETLRGTPRTRTIGVGRRADGRERTSTHDYGYR